MNRSMRGATLLMLATGALMAPSIPSPENLGPAPKKEKPKDLRPDEVAALGKKARKAYSKIMRETGDREKAKQVAMGIRG